MITSYSFDKEVYVDNLKITMITKQRYNLKISNYDY